jgi:hypothetical protein
LLTSSTAFAPVASRAGQTLPITLNDPLIVATVKKVDLAAIKDNDYVGVATRVASGGSRQASASPLRTSTPHDYHPPHGAVLHVVSAAAPAG